MPESQFFAQVPKHWLRLTPQDDFLKVAAAVPVALAGALKGWNGTWERMGQSEEELVLMSDMLRDARFLSCGDSALCVEFSREVDEQANTVALALASALDAEPPAGMQEALPTYRSVLVAYDPLVTSAREMTDHIRTCLTRIRPSDELGRRVEIPVYYGGDACLDLDELAEIKGMDREELIALHMSVEYRVYMIGFAPGFAYLGGLPMRLATPRKPVPRQMVPAGAIGIGGKQASVNSVAGPSAWHFIGQTPLRLFDPRRADPFLLDAGDNLRFRRIDEAEFEDLSARVSRGESPNVIRETAL